MSAQCETTGRRAAGKEMPFFERYLSIWVALCIVAGIALGRFLPGLFESLGSMEVASVNLPVAVLIWLMILPMLLKIDFNSLKEVRRHWKGVGVTLFINWGVKPFSMALLAWIFIRNLFSGWLPAEQLDSYIAGLILLAAAPCTAMVFVWSNLSDGHPGFTLSQVALNDLIMVFAFAPIVALLLGISSIHVPWNTLFLSVVLYIVLPVVVASAWRKWLMRDEQGETRLKRVLDRMHPVSLSALLITLVLLFGFQGGQITSKPIIILLLAIPIVIQVYFNSHLVTRLECSLDFGNFFGGLFRPLLNDSPYQIDRYLLGDLPDGGVDGLHHAQGHASPPVRADRRGDQGPDRRVLRFVPYL